MSVPLLLIIGLFTIQVLIIIIYSTYYHQWIPPMSGMAVAMAVGMTTGIFAGTIIGIFLYDDLFASTMYALLIGLSAGFIAGMPIGLPAVIEGTLSGLMGGMMGAMLGDMLALTRPEAIVNIVALTMVMVLVLVLYTVDDAVTRTSGKPAFTFFKHPFLLLLVITLLFIGWNAAGPVIIIN